MRYARKHICRWKDSNPYACLNTHMLFWPGISGDLHYGICTMALMGVGISSSFRRKRLIFGLPQDKFSHVASLTSEVFYYVLN